MSGNASTNVPVENTSDAESQDTNSLVLSLCGVLGYAAICAWIPILCLGAGLQRGQMVDFVSSVLPAEVQSLSTVFPAAFCLALCAIFGLVFWAVKDQFKSANRALIFWAVGFAAAFAGMATGNNWLAIVLFALSFTISRTLWSIHVLNKKLDARVIVLATLMVGVYYFLLSIAHVTQLALALPIMLMLSLCLMLPIFPTTFATREHMTNDQESATTSNFTLGQKLYGTFLRAISGIALGVLLYRLSFASSLFAIGLVWVCAGLSCLFMQRSKRISKTMLRGISSFGIVASLMLLPAIPVSAGTSIASLLLFFSITPLILTAVKNASNPEASDASEFRLFFFRHCTGMIGIAVGYVAGYTAFSIATPPAAGSMVFFAICACITIAVFFLMTGVFDEKRETPKMVTVTDVWHEKVQKVAKEAGLTPRQTEVFDCLSRGRNSKYIQQRLYLSEGAVKKYMYQIYKALGVHKQQDLITLVMNVKIEGYVSPLANKKLGDPSSGEESSAK